MELNFAKMEPLKSYQHVVNEIESAIFDGTLKEGDRLPSENKLKELFSTSRGTIREALRVLENKGLVSIKTGVKGGATVKEANTEAMSDGMAVLIRQQQVSLEHLAEFRAFLEGYAAEQAAVLANSQQLAELSTMVSDIKAHVESKPNGWNEFNRLDGDFHRKVAEIAGNPLIIANLTTIHENIHGYFQQFLPFSLELLKEDFDDLAKISAAIEAGDRAEAGEAARSHINKFNNLMRTKKQQEARVN